MKRLVVVLSAVIAMLGLATGTAAAQGGHFVTGGGNAPSCTDIGTQVRCTGKVAGLGGTTFTITVAAPGIASVECVNPAGQRAPGQDTAVEVAGSSGPLPTPRNGQFQFTITSDDPAPLPATPTCPNPKWTPEIVDVSFTTATLSLFENGDLSDQVTVAVT